MNPRDMQTAVQEIKKIYSKLSPSEDASVIISKRDSVVKRYQPIFALDYINNLTKEEFYSFLLFENNQHWNGLYRQGNIVTKNMNKLKDALRIILDENKEIDKRLDTAIPMVEGLGRALTTAILLVAYPTKYGVWNNTSESGLKSIKLWPTFERGENFGNKYVKINKVLNELAQNSGIDLWTLDSLFWKMIYSKEPGGDGGSPESDQGFGLEKHLHEFLRENWNKLTLAKEWNIYSEAEEPEKGFEYPTDIGRIDLLAKHKQGKRWLIIELKKNQSSDTTVGQILRYMSWVKNHLAKKQDKVEGLIISKTKDKQLDYALKMVNNVAVNLYEVEFKLKTI